jgi:hypothetical protein
VADAKGANVTIGSLRARGEGTRAAASDVAQAVTHGIEAGAAGARGHVDLTQLRLRLPPGAGPRDISRALERAIAQAAKGKP